MKNYELQIAAHWYVRCDGVHRIKFSERDLLDSGLEPEQYAARLFEQATFPRVSWHDFSHDVKYEKEQILGDIEIDPIWGLIGNIAATKSDGEDI